jgi:hypothetical protein
MSEEATAHPLGELDGESITRVVVTVKGGGVLERLPDEGERALLAIEGTFRFDAVKRVDGQLVRQLVVKAEKLAEVGESLADDVERFVQEVSDRQEGRQQLPFEDESDQEGEEPDER